MVEVLDLKFKELITSEEIQARVDDISDKLNERFANKKPIFL